MYASVHTSIYNSTPP